MNNLQFGRFTWCPAQRKLLVDGQSAPLGSRAFDVLSVLIEHSHRVVTKAELLDRAWSGLVVEENNLTVQISALRKLLGSDSILTVPARGYRWALTPSASDAGAAPGEPRRPSIAVLPFANSGKDNSQEYLADGLAEDIAAGLARSPWLFVIAQDSARTFRDSPLSVQEISERLGVRYLVRGSVRLLSGTLRISVELLHAPTGEVLLSERQDRPAEDLFAVQDEVTRRIVGTIEPLFLKREEATAVRVPRGDLRHWDLIMQARWHYWRSSRKHAAEAKRLLRQALVLRPDDVSALSLLAFSLATDVWSGWAEDPKAVALEANRLAMRAVAIDDRDSFAHFTLGVVVLGFGQLDRAIAEQRRALELYPHFAAAQAELGRLLAFSGQTDEAVRLITQAIQGSPTEPRMSLWIFGIAIARFVDGDYADAARLAADAISHRPDWFFNHFLSATALSWLGDLPGARQALAEGQRLLPTFNTAALRVGHPFRHDEHRERYIEGLRRVGWTG